MPELNKKIGELLLERGLIQDSDLRKALQLQQSTGGRLGSILIRVGAVSEEALLPVLSEQLDMPYLVREELPRQADVFDFLSASTMPLDWFIDQQVVLWEQEDEGIACLAVDPINSFIREVLERFYGPGAIRYCLSSQHLIESFIDYIRREHAVEDLFQGGGERALAELAEEAPIIEFVNNMMAQAMDAGASDIHVEPGERNFAVRFRVDGVLHQRLEQPQDRFPAIASRIKLIAGLDIAERRMPQDGRLTTRVSGKEMDIRVSTAPDVRGESIVMRLLPKQRDEVALSQLGMEQDHLERMKAWAHEAHGIVLVTGPTGSGKSTTLYSTLEATNDGQKKIITVEDPVEFQLAGITQIQAHAEIGYSFGRALKAILRQDPDVIMIGEIRDLETAEIAIQSALTGHLVLSTLHTNDAISAFTRLIDMGVEPFLVAAPMLGVQAQRLVRTLCQHCSEPDDIGEQLRREIADVPGFDGGEITARRAVGCKHCQGTGYRGRSGIYELVQVTPELHEMIVQNRPIHEMRMQAHAQGDRTLRQDGLLKVAKGVTSLEEVFRVTGTEAEAA